MSQTWEKTKYPGIQKNEKGDCKVRYRISSVDARSKTFLKTRYPATLKAALDFQAETRKAKNEGQMTDPKAGRVTLGEYARTKWYPSKVQDPDIEPRTLTNHRTRLGIDREGNSRGSGHYDFLSTMPIRTITYSDIERWRNEFLEDHSATTVNGSLAALGQIFKRARRDRLVAHNPCDDVSRLKSGARRLIIPASQQAIRALADAHPDRYRTAILVAAFTGLRAGELWSLRRDCVNEVKGTIDVVEAVKDDSGHIITGPTKSKERRTISIDKETAALLSQQMNDYPSESDLVFTTERGCQVRHNNFSEDHYVPIVKSLGSALPSAKNGKGELTAFRFHDLRHSHASHLIARGVSLSDVADRLGHASVRTTEDWYKHLFEDHDAHLKSLLGDLVRETLADAPSEVSRVLGAS